MSILAITLVAAILISLKSPGRARDFMLSVLAVLVIVAVCILGLGLVTIGLP